MIKTESLTRHFQLGEQVTALDSVSVSISAGEYVAVTGPSGSGKSTFMGIVGCLDRPTFGKCWIDGVETSDLLLMIWPQQEIAKSASSFKISIFSIG